MSTLYLCSVLAALLLAMWEAKLIKADRPIRHGLWLSILAFGGGILAAFIVGPWWALVALPGMAALFSAWFRMVLNAKRGLLPSYMGPDASDTSAQRSQYDLLCWRVAEVLGWQPITVALAMECTAIITTSIIFNYCY